MPRGPPTANRLLATLPTDEREHLLERSEAVALTFAEPVAEAGEALDHVYFPSTAFLSLVTAIDGQARVEVGLVGAEGMLGAHLALGVNRCPTRVLVQGGGKALRMDAATFEDEIGRSPGLRSVLKRYLHVTLEQLAQTPACTRFHRVGPRLARWLLMTRDRAASDTLDVTHEFLAYMLGVRRVGITEAASRLQARGLIRYHRGRLAILDGPGLEAAACGCYEADNRIYDRTMPAPNA